MGFKTGIQKWDPDNAQRLRVTGLLVSAPGISSSTALRGDHLSPDFQEDYNRFAPLIQEPFASQLSCEQWWENANLAAFCWKQLLSASNPPLPLQSGTDLQNKMLTGRYRTGLLRASTKLPAPEMHPLTTPAGSPQGVGFGIGYWFLLDW